MVVCSLKRLCAEVVCWLTFDETGCSDGKKKRLLFHLCVVVDITLCSWEKGEIESVRSFVLGEWRV